MTKTSKTETPVFIPCGRCGGRGVIEHFGHVFSGVCFECAGRKGKMSTVEHEARKARARERAAELEEALEASQAALELTDDPAEAGALVARRSSLRGRLSELLEASAADRAPVLGVRVEDAWHACRTDDERRAVLLAERVRAVVRPSSSPRFDPARVEVLVNS